MKIFAIFAIIFGSSISLANWVYFFQNLINKNKDPHPTFPIIDALFLALGLAYFKTTKNFAILSIIADYGTFILILSIPFLIKEGWKTNRFNLLKKFVGKTRVAKYELMLYKRDYFVIKINYDPPQTYDEHGTKIINSGMTGKWHDKNGFIEFKEDNGKCFKLIPYDSSYKLKEPDYPKNQKYNYDCLDGIDFILQN